MQGMYHTNKEKYNRSHLTVTQSEENVMQYYKSNSFCITHVLLRCRSEIMAPNYRKCRIPMENCRKKNEAGRGGDDKAGGDVVDKMKTNLPTSTASTLSRKVTKPKIQ